MQLRLLLLLILSISLYVELKLLFYIPEFLLKWDANSTNTMSTLKTARKKKRKGTHKHFHSSGGT